MKVLNIFLLVVMFCVSNVSLIAQETAGLIFGQFNGLNATMINPAFAFNSPNKWDVRVAGAHAYLQTDYAYINRSNLIRTLNNLDELSEQINPEDNLPNNGDLVTIYKTDNSNSYAHSKAEVLGPGIMFNLNPKTKFGLSIKSRAFAAVANIPNAFNYYEINANLVGVTYDSQKLSGASAAWTDIEILAAHQFTNKIAGGLKLKYNVGVGGLYFGTDQDFSYSSPDLETINATSSGTFSFSEASFDTDGMFGNGAGMDIGLTIRNIFNQTNQLGISIIDIGYTNFDSRDTKYVFDQNLSLNRADYESIRSISALSNRLETDFTVEERKDILKIYHPSALSIQYSHTINEKIKVEGALTQRIKLGANQIARSNSLLLAGVYDTKHFSAFLPFSIINYKRINPGLAFRVFFLTIGSDDLLSLFGKQRFNGTDLYVNIRVYPFQRNSKNDKSVNCYNF